MKSGLCAVVLAGLAATPVAAQDWSGNLTLYGWLPTLEGETVGPDGEPILDISAEELLEALDAVFFATGEIRRGRAALLFDAAFVDLSSEVEARPPFTATAGLETAVSFGSLSFGWRAVDGAGTAVDVYGGVRAYDASIGVDVTLAGGAVSRSVEGGVHWVDPIIGLRGRHAFGERVAVVGFADVGGFGIGSELTWQAYAGLSYDFTDSIAAQLGYRTMSIDYEGDIALNFNLTGPVLGLTFRF